MYNEGNMARRTKEDAQKTKESILHAAIEVFSTKGYSKTTFDDIAKQIGLTKGAVYWHFKNKLDLLTELILKDVNNNLNKLYKDKLLNEADIKEFFIRLANNVETNPRHRKLLTFVFYQMEWSELMMAAIEKSLKEVIDIPVYYLRDALLEMQKNDQIRQAVSAPTCVLWLCLLTKY